MLVKSMNFVLVLIKWKARIDFWKSQMETRHRLSRRYQHAGESWITHDNGNKSAFRGFVCFGVFFFLSQVPFSKIYEFLTLSHSTNTKSKETYALTTPHRIWFNGLQLWGSTGRQTLWMIQEQLPLIPLGHSEEYLPLNSAGLPGQPQTRHRVGRHQNVVHGASRKPD